MDINKDRVIEYMKGLTILLVVIAHVSRMYTPKGAIPVNGDNTILLYLTNYIYTFHMPVFVAISGMVFNICKVKLNKYNSFKVFMSNKFKRLMVPFFLFLFIMVVPVLHIVDLWDGWGKIVLMKDLRHLWYLPTLFFVLLIIYGLEPFIKRNKYASFFILLLISLVSSFFPHYFQISNVARYLVYFYLGYLFEEWRNDNNNVSYKSLFLVFSFQLICFVGLSVIAGKRSFGLGTVLNTLCAVSGLYIVYGFCYMLSRIKGTFISTFMEAMSRDSYGIYLIHPMIIYLLYYAIRNESYNSWLVFLIIFIIALSLSILLTRLIRRSCLRFAIGE